MSVAIKKFIKQRESLRNNWRAGYVERRKSGSEGVLRNLPNGKALMFLPYLTKKRVVNDGQIPQYYVEESHPSIIDKEMWECVQLEMQRRRAFAEKYNISKFDYSTVDNPFAGRVICGVCGGVFGRKVWNSTDDRLRRVIWRCNSKYNKKGEKGCENRHIDDGVIAKVFVNVFNTLVENKEHFLEKWEKTKSSDNILYKFRAKQFIKIVSRENKLEEFNIDLYFRMIEKFTVMDATKIIVTLLDGTGIECEIE